MYTLAGEWGTGSHPLGLPSIDVSRQSTGLGKTMRLKTSKSEDLPHLRVHYTQGPVAEARAGVARGAFQSPPRE